MQKVFLSFIAPSILCFVALPTATQAQSDAAKLYKTNCALCHSANGSGDSPSGKALHAKDLRSEEVQRQSDEALSEVITKGKGKMPAFGAKIKPDDVTNLVSYLRALPKQK
ncbi:MAG TPA: cytochrome c [Terriglobales bacterium]|nr:cytochrome c [Terriglobales bacterium]